MQIILDLIQRRRDAFDQHPFIRFLRDESVPPRQRLGYAPFASHFVLTFYDFNKEFLHNDVVDSPLQEMVNQHAKEDASHVGWYLHDLGILGFNPQCHYVDALKFLWSDLGKHTRALGHFLIASTHNTDATMRLVIIEAIEAQGNVWLTSTTQAAKSHPDRDKLRYFSQSHLDRETGHAIGSDVDEIRNIVISDEMRPRAEEIVHGIFDRSEDFCAELLRRTLRATESEEHGFSAELNRGRVTS